MAHTAAPITSRAYGFMLVAIGVIVILASSIFIMLPSPSLLPNQQSAFGTVQVENGKIAFSSSRDDNNGEIYVMNADGSDVTRLTNNATFDSSPSWSPDGTKIAFHRQEEFVYPLNLEIYVMNADDGNDQTRLTDNSAHDFDPSWSPDGTKIAFASTRGSDGIFVMNAADGSGQTRLTNGGGTNPSWSPDGTKIAFTSPRDGDYEIFVMNAADGSGQTRLTDNSADDSSPSWSPDGTKIAFTSTRDGNLEVYVMNADGSDVTRLTNNAASDFGSSWSPDGTKIAFTSTRDGAYEIYVMNADDGSGQTNITNHPAADYYPAFSSGAATQPPEEDTTPPVIIVPEDIVVDATTANGGTVVTYNVTAEDNVDGTATLEEDGTTITQDDVGGDITISCDPASGSEFPIGDTQVQCTATDAAGNEGTASFTVTVNPPSPPTPAQVIEKLISTIQNLDDVPQSVKTSLIAVLNQVLNILSDNNPNNDESVCGKLGALINQANATESRGTTLTPDQADELRTQAEDIRNKLLSC